MTNKRDPLDDAVATEEKQTKFLVCDLTSDEQRERGLELANALAGKRQLEDDKKAVVNDFKARELENATKINQLEQVVTTRREYRETECTDWRDYKAGKVYVVRDDLGTIVDTRQMTARERQQLLPETIAEPEQLGLEKTGENKTNASAGSKKKTGQAARAASAQTSA